MSDIFSKQKPKLRTFLKVAEKPIPKNPIDIPDGLFIECEQCHLALYQKALQENLSVCPHCQFHFRLKANDRLALMVDEGTFVETETTIQSKNPLGMPEYEQKVSVAVKSTGRNEAFISGLASIQGIPVAIGVLDSFFMMGSMGSVVGEKITRLIELAIEKSLPLIIFSASGGARMQEGILSLMQMVKTSAALKKLDQAGGLFISVLTHPTTGGVAASYASLGDVIIAEHGALIGFAGARVIKQTIQQDLPEGFQTAAFQLKHGQVDLVVERKQLKQTLLQVLHFHGQLGTQHG
ncbi:MAG: acetyl-CoA carboxylase, carboxyltransferase subunit beta [Bacilli bacterium]